MVYLKNPEEIVKAITRTRENPIILQNFLEVIGIDYSWVEKQFSRKLLFGPAEQSNPFFTVYSYARRNSVFPASLHKELTKEEDLEGLLNSCGIGSRFGFLTLENDSFSSGGVTARYSFNLDNENIVSFFTKKQKHDNSCRPFSDVNISREEICKIIRSIDSSHERTELKWMFENDLELAWLYSSNRGTARYYDFSNEFNKASLRYFLSSDLEIFPIDSLCLNSLVEGVKDWKKLFGFLIENKLLAQGETVFRLLTETDNGNKFIRLGFDGRKLVNLDYNSKKIGDPEYEIERVVHDISLPAYFERKPKLFISKSIEYPILMSGMANIMLADDGVLFDRMHETSKVLKKFGLTPIITTYCPHNEGLKDYSSKDLNQEYTFNSSCSVFRFYEYIAKLKNERQKRNSQKIAQEA